MSKRDTFRYCLKEGNKIVYIGITNNFERRFVEHEKVKEFRTMQKVGPKVSRDTAEKWESERLNTYSKNHQGRLPEYNKTKNGK